MPKYFEFEVSLNGIEPRIWRRFLVRAAGRFHDLHMAIQKSFGWWDYHLWEFRCSGLEGRPIAGVPDEEDSWDRIVPDGRIVKLADYFTGIRTLEWCEYVYDFGDDWVHEVKLVRLVKDKAIFRRRLLDGARACPHEDCGGVPGYEHILHFARTGEDTWENDPEGLAQWLDGWKPEAFDLQSAKAAFDK